MIRYAWVAVVSCGFIVPLLWGQAMVTDGQRHNEWGELRAGCRLGIRDTKKAYHYTDPIALRLVLENIGNQPVSVRHTNLMVVYRFDVRQPNGNPAPLTLEGKRQAVFTRTYEDWVSSLAPGETVVDEIPMLNRLYDMTLLGEYTITIYRNVLPAGDNQEWVEVPSNQLKIVIHDEPEKQDKGGEIAQ